MVFICFQHLICNCSVYNCMYTHTKVSTFIKCGMHLGVYFSLLSNFHSICNSYWKLDYNPTWILSQDRQKHTFITEASVQICIKHMHENGYMLAVACMNIHVYICIYIYVERQKITKKKNIRENSIKIKNFSCFSNWLGAFPFVWAS